MLHDSNCVTFWKRPNHGSNKRSGVARDGGGEGETDRQSTEDLEGSE